MATTTHLTRIHGTRYALSAAGPNVRLYRSEHGCYDYVGTVGSMDEALDAAKADAYGPDMSEASSPCGWRAPR